MKAHVITNGKIVNTIEVEDLTSLPNLVAATEGEIGWLYENGAFVNPNRKSQAEIDAEAAKSMRVTRNKKLADSDWTQFTDSPLDADAKLVWALYRETLRMVPQQAGFPWEINWPPEPGA
jgi:hypothetical protein